MKEVANQIDDIPNALKGKIRKGRKVKSLGKMTMGKKKEDPYYKNSKKLNK